MTRLRVDPDQGDRTMQWGCSCGNVAYVKNCEYVTTKDPCENCMDLDEVAGETPGVTAEMGWCCCGTPEQVDSLMFTYLRSLMLPLHDRRYPEGADLLCAYMADDLGWTEHGGSIGFPWFTDAGLSAFANLGVLLGEGDEARRLVAEYEEKRR